MTTVYGSWVPNSTTNQRMRLRLEYTVPSVTAGQTSVTVTGSVYVEAGYSFNDSNNTFSWSGSLLGSGSSAKSINVATNGSQQIHTFSKSVTLTDSAQGLTVAFSLTGVDYVGASNTASVSATVTIPARVYLAPNAPSGETVTRVSDSRHDLAWAATATADRPIASFEVQKWRLSTGSYAPQASVSDSARAYVDNGSHPNDQLEWRIRAVNTAGVSAWVYFPVVWTTPAAASSVTVQRAGSDATVSWTINARDAQSQTLQGQESSDGGATWTSWTNLTGHVGFSASATSRVVTGLDPVKQHRIRVVSTVTTPATLNAYSVASNTLQLLTAPQAPSLVVLGTVSNQSATMLRWTHRPVDTTDQTAAEVAWRASGASTWTTIAVTGNAQSTTVAAGVLPLGGVEWRVRTKGQHADWSPWSSVGVFTVAQPPAVAITSPANLATIGSNRLTLTVSYSDPQSAAMTGWRAELFAGGQVIETMTGSGATSSVQFATTLGNLTSYSATFRATAGTGLQSATASVSVSVNFLPPPAPVLTASWDEPSGTTQLTVAVPAPGVGEAATDYSRIERSGDDGTAWTVIADDLPPGAGVGDDTAPLNDTLMYRAVSVSALGTEAASVARVVETPSYRVWLRTTDGDTLMLAYDIQVTGSDGHEVVLEDYFGHTKPIAHFGEEEPTTVQVTARVARGYGIEQNRKKFLRKPVFYRDPFGRTFWATLTPGGIQMAQSSTSLGVISFTVEEITND